MSETRATTETSIESSIVEVLGRQIFDAERSAEPIRPLSDSYELTVGDAYAIQQSYARLRIGEGATVIGHKIGCTAKAIQELFKIDTPDFGHLFSDMLVPQSKQIPVDELIQPLTEPEIAFVLAQDLSGPGITQEDVLAASSGVVPCIEVIDSRIIDWNIHLSDTISDNGSSARFVMGEPIPVDGIDLAAETVVLTRNGEEVGRGEGTAVLGHPANSVAWLANALGEFGQALPAGSYVLSGSLTTAVPARAGDRFQADFASIGSVSCLFAGPTARGAEPHP